MKREMIDGSYRTVLTSDEFWMLANGAEFKYVIDEFDETIVQRPNHYDSVAEIEGICHITVKFPGFKAKSWRNFNFTNEHGEIKNIYFSLEQGWETFIDNKFYVYNETRFLETDELLGIIEQIYPNKMNNFEKCIHRAIKKGKIEL